MAARNQCFGGVKKCVGDASANVHEIRLQDVRSAIAG
jgi:hypothetical protein